MMTTNENAVSAQIETLVAELTECTTSAMWKSVEDTLFGVCKTPYAATVASEKLAELAGKHDNYKVASRLYNLSSAMNDHRHLIREVAHGNTSEAMYHSKRIGDSLASIRRTFK